MKRSEVEPLPFNKDLYYIDDRRLIIAELNLNRTKVRIGSDYFEAHDFLVEQNSTLGKNGLSNSTKSTGRVGT